MTAPVGADKVRIIYRLRIFSEEQREDLEKLASLVYTKKAQILRGDDVRSGSRHRCGSDSASLPQGRQMTGDTEDDNGRRRPDR